MDTDDITVVHDEDNGRFFCIVNGQECIAEYTEVSDDILDFYHTEVPEALRGKGIAHRIYDVISVFLRENNFHVVPSCSFARKYFEAKPDLKKLIIEL